MKLKVHVQHRMAERFGLVSQIYGFNKLLLLEHFSFHLNSFPDRRRLVLFNPPFLLLYFTPVFIIPFITSIFVSLVLFRRLQSRHLQ